MKIAVVAPCPVPYVVGGAEKLWWGLVGHLNERTIHPTELIKLPSPEGNLPALIASYDQFATLDLSGFDLVISGKYPAWMVGHPRHVVYMLHRLRGLYDSYPGTLELAPDTARDPAVAALRAYMRRTAGRRSALSEFFERTSEVLAQSERLPGILDFPGPFARELVHWLDNVALSRDAIERYAAISNTVAERVDYFPAGIKVHVAWPPPRTVRVPGGRQEHFFTASRLDGPKRVALLIEAMQHVQANIPLLIAGTGPDEARLKTLAAGDARIRFLGFQSDQAIADLYANALAVPFVPYAEDYGLITVEAMRAGKPVVTTSDAGGPCELVADGETGLVCGAEPQSLGLALQRLADDLAWAATLGRAGAKRAEAISWDAVVEQVIPQGPALVREASSSVKKLVVATTFGIYPPRHGGQSRVYHLYASLFPEYETTIVSFGDAAGPAFDREIAPGLREVRVPKSREHDAREREMTPEVGVPITDVLMPELAHLSPLYGEALAREAATAYRVIACHPFLFPLLQGLGVPVWYEAQDLEWKLKQEVLSGTATGRRLLESVRQVEGDCACAAELVVCASVTDAADLASIYGMAPTSVVIAPNGTDSSRITYTDHAARTRVKTSMDLGMQRFVLFMGSGHWPNIEAVRRIFTMSAAAPDVVFVVVGSVCYAFPPGGAPPNALMLGEVDDVTRNLALEFCDVALNPMEHGTGTNLKMLDFLAAGIPVVSTPIGARGIGVEDGVHARIVELADFVPAIYTLLGAPAEELDAVTRAARDLVEREFDWAAIGARVKLELATRFGD
jgi:glycosyltransferase involved in cell wall biosynthesis